MKKMFVLFALCAMATSLMADVVFDPAQYTAGGITLPVVYTGMLKLNGWGDEGLCYNWQSNRNSYPLFLGLCQPCLECVPCDIDMRHLEPKIQYGTSYDGVENAYPENAETVGGKDNTDPTEAYFNRARLYVVTGTTPTEKDEDGEIIQNKTVKIKVIDLIDAYWGKNWDLFGGDFMFQFYNTVQSKGVEKEVDGMAAKGRIAAFYRFPIYTRDFYYKEAVETSKKVNGMNNVTINNFNRQDQETETAADCDNWNYANNSAGYAAVIGTKDYKAFFKVDKKSYKLITIKSFSGDFFALQRETYEASPADGTQPITNANYVCRKGEDFVRFVNPKTKAEVGVNNTEYDGRGAWYAAGNITLRRNDSVTKKLMAAVIEGEKAGSKCIPCNYGTVGLECRSYLDQGVVENLIDRQYKGWDIVYIVDLDNDGIYGEKKNICGDAHFQEFFKVAKNTKVKDNVYLHSLVNTTTDNDGESSEYAKYKLMKASAELKD